MIFQMVSGVLLLMAMRGCNRNYSCASVPGAIVKAHCCYKNTAVPEGHKMHEENAEYQCLLCWRCTSYARLTHMPQNTTMNQNR